MPYYRKQLTVVMQEPLLFNESIKENILLGDEFASDQKIREVSVQTNSLPFILQSDDNFNSLSVQARLKQSFLKICTENNLGKHY
jgi:ABC-type multidrug transport system fused ATPase/permease subunit